MFITKICTAPTIRVYNNDDDDDDDDNNNNNNNNRFVQL